MNKPARIAAALLIAALGVFFSIKLAVFSERDDAPGGVVIAVLLMFCSVGFAIWLALRKPTNHSAGVD